jgi:hypothetical protein
MLRTKQSDRNSKSGARGPGRWRRPGLGPSRQDGRRGRWAGGERKERRHWRAGLKRAPGYICQRMSGGARLGLGGSCGICYEFFTNLTSTTLAAKTTDA